MIRISLEHLRMLEGQILAFDERHHLRYRVAWESPLGRRRSARTAPHPGADDLLADTKQPTRTAQLIYFRSKSQPPLSEIHLAARSDTSNAEKGIAKSPHAINSERALSGSRLVS
jgi:hypothetical protein